MGLGVGSVFNGRGFNHTNIFNRGINDDSISLESSSDDSLALSSLSPSPESDLLSDSPESDFLSRSPESDSLMNSTESRLASLVLFPLADPLEVAKNGQENRGDVITVSPAKGSRSPFVMKRHVPCDMNPDESVDSFDDFDLGFSPNSRTPKRHCSPNTTKRIVSSRALTSFFSASVSSIPNTSSSTTDKPPLQEPDVVSRSEPQSSSSSTLPRCSSLPLPQISSLPLPSQAAFNGRIIKSKFVPPTPCKKPPSRTFTIPGMVNPIKELFDKYTAIIRGLLNNRFNYKEKNFQVELIEGAKGAYKQAFTVCSGQSDIIPGLSNEQILIKAYHEDCLAKDYATILQMNQNAISQYKKCVQNGIPVAKIYNIDPTTNSLIGDVFIVQKINYALDTEQWAIQADGTDPLKDKRPADFLELVSMKKIFNRAIEKLLNLDLNPGNFRYDDKQTREVVLVDFREAEDLLPDQDEEEDEFNIHETIGNIFKDVKDCANNRLEVWNYLTSDFTRLNLNRIIAARVEQGTKEHEALENSIIQDDQY